MQQQDQTATATADPADAFVVLANLLAIVADPQKLRARLAELREAEQRATAAAAKLEADTRAAYDTMSRERGEFEEQRRLLAQREVRLRNEEARLATVEQAQRQKQEDLDARSGRFDRNFSEGSSLVREYSLDRPAHDRKIGANNLRPEPDPVFGGGRA